MTREHVTIVGAGAAGLSVARALSRVVSPPEILLLEARDSIPADRTWSSWFSGAEAERLPLRHRWPRWSVHGEGRSVVRGAGNVVYGSIDSAVYAETVLADLATRDRVSVRFGCQVGAVAERAGRLELETSHGPVTTDRVFDSRPRGLAPAEPGDVTLLQRFEGWEIVAPRPCFDPGVATIMDFRVESGPGVHFVYVLPFDRTRALVEDTWIVPSGIGPLDHAAHLRSHLAERFDLDRFTVARSEAGALPMSTREFVRPEHPRHLAIGVAGGWMRPSTGYSFRNALFQAEALADACADGDLDRWSFQRSRVLRALDHVFLRFLRDEPERGAEAFVRLFERADGDAVVRFLEGSHDLRALAEVVRALPPGPLTAASMRTASAGWAS